MATSMKRISAIATAVVCSILAAAQDLNTFQATVSLTVGDSVLTEQEVARRFVESYNKWEETNPNVCDPFQRQFTSIDSLEAVPVDTRRLRYLQREEAFAQGDLLTKLFISMTGV